MHPDFTLLLLTLESAQRAGPAAAAEDQCCGPQVTSPGRRRLRAVVRQLLPMGLVQVPQHQVTHSLQTVKPQAPVAGLYNYVRYIPWNRTINLNVRMTVMHHDGKSAVTKV